MQFKNNVIIFFLLSLLPLTLSSCFNTEHLEGMDNNTERLAKEVEADREYIKAMLEELKLAREELKLVREIMTFEMKRMADALVTLQTTSVEVFKLFMEQIFKPSTPAKTQDLKDIMADPAFELPPSPLSSEEQNR